MHRSCWHRGRQAVLFAFIANCPHAVILGLNILAEHSALINCSAPSDFLLLDPADPTPSRLCSIEHVRLPPQTLTYIDFVSLPPVPDGDYVFVPIIDIFLTHSITVPHTVRSIGANCICLPVVTFGLTPQELPQGIALICTFHGDEVEAFKVTTSSGSSAPDQSDS